MDRLTERFRDIELVYDMREVSQHPSGARYLKEDAVILLEMFADAGGRVALINHPHSTPAAYEDLEYITNTYEGPVALGAHFRLDFKNGYNGDSVFDKSLKLPVDWVSLFLDVSPASEARHPNRDWNRTLEHTTDLITKVLDYGKEVRVTTEHAITTFLSDDERAYERGARLLTTAYAAGARWFNLPDTTGINDPHIEERSLKNAAFHAAHILDSPVRINVHAHNDQNTAEEGVLDALIHGPASLADLTPGGIGERNGIGDLYTIASHLENRTGQSGFDREKLRELRSYSNILLGIHNPNQSVDGEYSRSVTAGTHFSAMFKKQDDGSWEFTAYYNRHFKDTSQGEKDMNVVFTHQSNRLMYEYLLNNQGIEVPKSEQHALGHACALAKRMSWERGSAIPPEQLRQLYLTHGRTKRP